MKKWTNDQLEPFGIIVRSEVEGSQLRDVPSAEIQRVIAENRVVVFRGFALLCGEEFPEFCSQFGEVLEFDFGVVNELQRVPDAKNYLYAAADVPFHWDGAFIGRVPKFIFFHCDYAPESGGETVFTDTTVVLRTAPPELVDKWRGIEITYTTEKVVHYGGGIFVAHDS